MYDVFYWVHVIAAISLLFYIALPIVAFAAAIGVRGLAGRVRAFNRIGQYVLIVSFLSGGYLVSKVDYPTAWMVTAIVLLLVMFAMTGMSTKPIKALTQDGADKERAARKLRVFSLINALALVALYLIMYNPDWFL